MKSDSFEGTSRSSSSPGDSSQILFDKSTDVYLARSTDGGSTFTNSRISQSPFLPNTRSFLGDYVQIVASSRSLHPIWTRIDRTELSIWTTTIQDSILTGFTRPHRLPETFSLDQNYPNPFNGSTVIRFSLPARSQASLKVYDLLGREVRRLAEGEFEAGIQSVMLYADDLPSGVYIYRFRSSQFRASRKLLITR